MDFLDKKLLEYSELHTTAESKLLQKVNRETYVEVLQPHMLSGHLQGRFLSLISKLIKPKFILEIGTYTGYSALCFAEGLREGGKVITLDCNDELEDRVRNYISEAGLEGKIEMRIGDAHIIIPELDYVFDLVFIDADKEGYLNYFDLVLPKVRSGGVIIADNVLSRGRLVDEDEKVRNQKIVKAIDLFNKKVMECEEVENLVIPIRDGLMVAIKK